MLANNNSSILTSVKITTSIFFSFLEVNNDVSPNSIFETLLCLAAELSCLHCLNQ